jgi:hypothetical protein
LQGGEPFAQQRVVLFAPVRAPQPLHVVRQPRVAAHFVGLASVLGGTQARGPLGLAVPEQAVLPVGGLLVTVGPFRKLAEKASGRGPQDLRGCLLEGAAGPPDSASACRASTSTTISDTVCSTLTRLFSFAISPPTQDATPRKAGWQHANGLVLIDFWSGLREVRTMLRALSGEKRPRSVPRAVWIDGGDLVDQTTPPRSSPTLRFPCTRRGRRPTRPGTSLASNPARPKTRMRTSRAPPTPTGPLNGERVAVPGPENPATLSLYGDISATDSTTRVGP